MLTSLFASVALLSAIIVPAQGVGRPAPAVAAAHATRPVQRLQPLIFRGVTTPTKLSEVRANTAAPVNLRPRLLQQRGYRAIDIHPAMHARSAAFVSAALPIPSVPSRRVVPADPDFFGFSGLNNLDQSTAGTGRYTNSQYSLEPPDQGLCAGNGYVIDAVNNAVAVYSNFGTRLTAPTALNQFFGLLPELDPKTNLSGQFLSDPRCYFDRDTQRWFVTELEIDTVPSTGAFATHSSTLIAVSRTADPTGAYNVYSFDTTDAANPNCPCFGDQPLIGADANGFYVSSNEFPISGAGFNGDQTYALSKRGLTTGRGSTVVHIDAGVLPTPDLNGGPWYSIQPATSPDTSAAARTNNGTEYFLSSLDFFNNNDNRIAVWAITNTQSLRNPAPAIGFQHVVIGSVTYGQPPNAVQKAGPTPLGTSVGDPLEQLQTNDDRMQQVVFAAGRLWSGVNTAVRFGSKIDAGIAFFAAEPSFDRSGFLTARMAQNGYVAVAGENMMYPSIGVNPSGDAVMAATLVGPDYFPTAVYVTQNGLVHIAGAGVAPDDGFTGYAAFTGSNAGRWGDYSAAVADFDGSIWVAAEYIPGPRTQFANWGTFLGHVQIHH